MKRKAENCFTIFSQVSGNAACNNNKSQHLKLSSISKQTEGMEISRLKDLLKSDNERLEGHEEVTNTTVN